MARRTKTGGTNFVLPTESSFLPVFNDNKAHHETREDWRWNGPWNWSQQLGMVSVAVDVCTGQTDDGQGRLLEHHSFLFSIVWTAKPAFSPFLPFHFSSITRQCWQISGQTIRRRSIDRIQVDFGQSERVRRSINVGWADGPWPQPRSSTSSWLLQGTMNSKWCHYKHHYDCLAV